jgi:hypothetical protein
MLSRFAFVLSFALVAGCSTTTAPTAAGLCAVMVNIDGALLGEWRASVTADELGPQYATVQRSARCHDVIAAGAPTPLGDREAYGLAAGTPLYRFNGYAPTERLIVDRTAQGAGYWVFRAIETAP